MAAMLLLSLLDDKRRKLYSNATFMKKKKMANLTTSQTVAGIARLPLETCKKQLAELSKGLAHPVRVEIVRMLSQKPTDERCVCGDIVDAFPLSQSSISQHLKVLKETGWIQGTIDGPRVCYCIVEDIIDYHTALTERCLKKINS